MKGTKGPSLPEVLLVMAIGAIVAGFAIAVMNRRLENERRIRCRNNLNLLAKGMATYASISHWAPHWYPCPLRRGRHRGEYNGAEWLASLYWVGTVPDPGVFLCPSSGDRNADGVHLGETRAASEFGSRTVSYAGLHWRSLTASGGPVHSDFPDSEPMGSDDTQGTVNHGRGSGGGLSVLFGDSHVEWKTAQVLDPETAVGKPGGLLEKLRN